MVRSRDEIVASMDTFIRREFRTLAEFPDYEITSLGDIRKKKTKLKMTTYWNEGIETVFLSKNGKRYHRSVGQLVKSAFPGVVY